MASTAGPGRIQHSRAVSLVTAASCVVHLWLVAGNQHGPWLGAVMLAMAGVCLPCAVHLWRGAGERPLRQVMGCALAMTALHTVLLLAVPGSGGSLLGHAHAVAPAPGTVAGIGAGVGTASGAAVLMAIVGLEITTAFLAATLLARLRSVPGTAPLAAR